VRRHIRASQVTGGIMLIALGALRVTGLWGASIAWMRGPIAGYTLTPAGEKAIPLPTG
jgi:cytochrome c-type biogenesis protein